MISVTTYALVVVPAVCIGLGLAGYAWARFSAGRLDRARAAAEARPLGPAASKRA
ncbi:hypothetical protein [Methylobacterium sp. Leaf456]|uniref:hypothetical protein n=1 Tax=Methylobacterium sp. Leaf456 TaxID=1736382 RepID=UPI000A90FF4B|nr:hypothetical protein [Methylobacterium sp. Leaf456]